MSILADIFVATEEDARMYEERVLEGGPAEPPMYERVQLKGLTSLELGTLWALLQDQPWNVRTHKFTHIQHNEEVGSCLDAFPAEFIRVLAEFDQGQSSKVGGAWAATEELQWPEDDAIEVIHDLVRLAKSANVSGRGIYVWNCP